MNSTMFQTDPQQNGPGLFCHQSEGSYDTIILWAASRTESPILKAACLDARYGQRRSIFS